MTIKIDNGIVKFELVDNSSHEQDPQAGEFPMGEELKADEEFQASTKPQQRPEVLSGKTYRISAADKHATILVTVNEKTMPNGINTRPFELIIHSSQAEHFSWLNAISSLASALLQQGGELSSIANTLKRIFSPSGGFIDSNNQQHVSLLAAIGEILAQHLQHSMIQESDGMAAMI